MLLAPARISSMGALNQRSTDVITTRLPTIITSTDGMTVMPSMESTSLARKRPNGSPRRPSISDLTTLRASTNTSASSIVILVAESAISTTSVKKSGDSVEVRSASHTMPPSAASRMMIPARISGGLSRKGRRPGATAAGLTSVLLRGFAVATSLFLGVLRALQRPHLVREIVDVAEIAIHRCKAHVRDLIELLQLRHHERAELAPRNLALGTIVEDLFGPIGDVVDI